MNQKNKTQLKRKQKENIQDKVEEMQEEKPDTDDSKEEFKEISEKSNPILKRLINKEPKLFSTDKNKFFTEYSRLCPANVKKQPVILTKEEKDYIDLNHEILIQKVMNMEHKKVINIIIFAQDTGI